ncbi:MAG: translation initiation factor IF-2, partial [Lachnospiraceae bacterium]|nr:translation initiation factor IF-2 [Lachnospiraceae bacterium]
DGGSRGGQGSYGRSQDGGNRGGQGSYGRNQDGGSRGGQGSYGRSQDGGNRGGQGSYGRNGQNGGYSRNQDGGSRGGQGGRGMSIPKPSGDTKPLEKESRKRTERGDRNRADKGEKLDRMEKNVRPGQKNNQRGNQKNISKKGQPAAPAPKPAEKPAETIRTLTLPEKMTISELAEAMKMQASAIIKKLFLQGTIVTVNQEIDFDKAEEIALEFNCICEKEEKVDVIGELLKEEEEGEDLMIPRPPVVCVMGHVDHGKTSLLDAIRNTHVIDKEAGGITQHIGAYVVSINGQKITFLDTPGHEAFTAMRMRGANSTDIAILVVAADDGVMPQTIEAINHAKAAGIEIIVAINKIDKPSANIERVKQELSEYELIPEDWGGSTVMVPVSAHTHEGIDNLLEMILLTAEVLELKANPDRKARGLVIEAELDKGKGPVATVLVQKGTLHVGDPIAAGACHGKIRAMMDDKGRRVKQTGPSTPVEVLGLSDVPNAGEIFICMDSEKEARSFAETFISEGRERMLEDTKMRMSLDDLYSQIQAGKLKELDLIVKADVQGSVEAVKQSLLKLSNEEVVVKVIHSGVGAINESDVILASTSNAIIIGFNVRPDVMAKATAERENVDVRLYRVIYDAIADVEAAMKGMLDPIYEEKVIGHAEIRQLFKASGVGTIAGSYVLDGIFQRNCKVRITREDKQIYEGALASLKRFKDDVKEVRAGFECGFVFEKFNDIKEEDKVEAYVMVEVPR